MTRPSEVDPRTAASPVGGDPYVPPIKPGMRPIGDSLDSRKTA
jgi:hypothetical protein